jgi:ferritin-like metal-binding protein YciE
LEVKIILLKGLCHRSLLSSVSIKGIIFTRDVKSLVMHSINDLADLLMYNVKNLYGAEEQMLKVFPSFIEKAHHASLKNALTHHTSLIGEQKKRLSKIAKVVSEKKETGEMLLVDEVNKGISGLIGETNELLQSNVASDVTDAAIIAEVQKLQHYEICVCGTAHAYASQLRLQNVVDMLNETLQEEYDLDDLLTALATAAINKEALPQSITTTEASEEDKGREPSAGDEPSYGAVSIDERSINSPGGRAGTSHRRYGSGESRGH